MRYAVGLTGGIGSGKSTVAARFAERGIVVIDADAAAHRLTSPRGAAISAIHDAFGADFIDASGALDRDRMRERAFSDPAEKRRLEAILHPMIRDLCERQREAATSPYVLLVVPLLFESGNWQMRVQRTLVVDCSEEIQIERVMRRSGLTAEAVRAIMASQIAREARLALADDVIDNSGADYALDAPIVALHERYLRAASEFRSDDPA